MLQFKLLLLYKEVYEEIMKEEGGVHTLSIHSEKRIREGIFHAVFM